MIREDRGTWRRVVCWLHGHDWHRFESVPSGEWWACFSCDALTLDEERVYRSLR